MIATQLLQGVLPSDIDPEHRKAFEKLQKLGAIVEEDGVWKLHSMYRIGRLYVGTEGKGFVEAQFKEQRDLLIEPDYLGDAKRGDTVVAKRFLARRGRTSGKVVMILKRAHRHTLAYTQRDSRGEVELLDLRTAQPTQAHMGGITLNTFKVGTVFKVDTDTEEVLEILGHLDDPNVDEKISLALFDRRDAFPPECIEEAKGVESEVDASEHPDRIDLREMDFCTIDPVTAKDFDDAIHFDPVTHTLHVAIADVSHYVPFFSPIDREAVERGFTTYLPHRAFPMLPRELSEHICSLKPRVDRLAFVARIVLDPETLEPVEESFFEAIIHSKFRFHYDAVDGILAEGYDGDDPTIQRILSWLLPLHETTQKLRAIRLKDGFDFRSEEVKLTLNDAMLLQSTQVESGTPSHSLIEECMLLANRAAAKRFEGDGDGIFRIHEPPQLEKIEALLAELSAIGLYVETYEDSPSLIRAIQAEAERMGLSAEVDDLIIRSLRQASYSAHNVGHFGLGFEHYSHFTSPIRRYPDLLLHRLIKTQLSHNVKESGYLLRNIDPLCVRVSDLERRATKAEWDFRDRKFARWAQENQGKFFEAEVIAIDDTHAKARLDGDIQGVEVHLRGDKIMLFDRIRVMITDVDIAQSTIMAELVVKLERDAMEL
jgi:ribonuclease R